MPTDRRACEDLVRTTIYRATILLDDQKWEDWLALCDDSFHYAIKSFSPEINRDMIYLQGSRKDMSTMTKLLPKHNTDHSPLRRHTSVYTVDLAEDAKTAKAVSSVVIYQNLLDGVNSHIDAGESRLFLVGKYYDEFKKQGVNHFIGPDMGAIVITHYERILNYITPTHVHILIDGRIVRSGGFELATELERVGYAGLMEEVR